MELSESVGSEEVTMTLHEHFRAQFAAEGCQWHKDKEVDRAMRALFSDPYAGALAREQILQPGVWPRQLGPMISKEAQIGRGGTKLHGATMLPVWDGVPR